MPAVRPVSDLDCADVPAIPSRCLQAQPGTPAASRAEPSAITGSSVGRRHAHIVRRGQGDHQTLLPARSQPAAAEAISSARVVADLRRADRAGPDRPARLRAPRNGLRHLGPSRTGLIADAAPGRICGPVSAPIPATGYPRCVPPIAPAQPGTRTPAAAARKHLSLGPRGGPGQCEQVKGGGQAALGPSAPRRPKEKPAAGRGRIPARLLA